MIPDKGQKAVYPLKQSGIVEEVTRGNLNTNKWPNTFYVLALSQAQDHIEIPICLVPKPDKLKGSEVVYTESFINEETCLFYCTLEVKSGELEGKIYEAQEEF